MKLISLELSNFRQFHGDQEIEFAAGEDGESITVIHGFNGAGKTALLNAFVWCLYGKVTEDFENPDRLENEAAVALASPQSEIRVSACLRFEARGDIWRIERSRISVKDEYGAAVRQRDVLSLQRTLRNGEFEEIVPESSRQERINQILPETLYPFFFFNGERVERLARDDAYNRVEEGVKTLLDIERYERGSRHLRKNVRAALLRDLRDTGEAELEEAQKKEAVLDLEEQGLLAATEVHSANIAGFDAQLRALEEQQASIREVDELTKERERLRSEERRLRERLGSARQELARHLSRNGYLAFAPRALDSTEREIDAARSKGDIPGKIKPQFVADIIEDGRCICGSPIVSGSPQEDSLLKWKHQTGLAELEDRILMVKAGIGSLRERREEFFRHIDSATVELSGLTGDIERCIADLSSVESKLGDRRLNEDAAALQEQIGATQRGRDKENQKLGAVNGELARAREELAGVKAAIQKISAKSEQGKLIQRQLQAIENVAGALDAIAAIQKEDVRESLDRQIAEIWRDAAIRDYTASVTADFKLQLTKMVDGRPQLVSGASTGEKQVLALSFVASLVRKARENAAKDDLLGVTGGFYPIVMDSPFGSLADHYRAKVAHWLPSLTKQVVVMVSNTQWRDEVESEMRPKVGKEYVLELHTPKPGQDRDVIVRGVAMPYVRSSGDGSEMTLIKRVS